MSTVAVTLNRHILEEEQRHPEATGHLSALLVQLGFAAKILAREIGRAALVGKLGLIGERNPTGDGRASTGAKRILDIQAKSIHQRAPLVIGSAEDVARYEQFVKDGRPA